MRTPSPLRPKGPLSAFRCALLLAPVTLSACGPELKPPPPLIAEDLPISGSLADARGAGFTACRPDDRSVRCRRDGVRFAGMGPFNAAVDLRGGDGAGGFSMLTLWHDTDQSALVKVTDKLRREGWTECLAPVGERWAEQAIYQRAGAPIFVALDLSYWNKRRLMLHPATTPAPRCKA